MKMYILVRDDIPLGFAMVAVAHASLTCYLKYQDEPGMKSWLTNAISRPTWCQRAVGRCGRLAS